MILFWTILCLCVVLLVAVAIYDIKYRKAKAQLKELETAQQQIAKLKKDYNSARSARDKVMCDYNSLTANIVELVEDYPDKPVRNLGMRFMNEIKDYIRVDEKSGKMYLKVIK